MTVSEMIEFLKKMPQDARVVPCRPALESGEKPKDGPGDFIEVVAMSGVVLLVTDV